jgi:hypothetical protein
MQSDQALILVAQFLCFDFEPLHPKFKVSQIKNPLKYVDNEKQISDQYKTSSSG